jgi:hypothetical protein
MLCPPVSYSDVSGVKTNQSSLIDIIEEIDIKNKAQVLRGNNCWQSTATAQGFSQSHLFKELKNTLIFR